MDITNPKIDAYLSKTLASDDALLREMEEWARARHFPIVGPQVGRLMHLLARSIHAKRVLELGSGYGYSGIWFARAVGAEGIVVMTEGDAENSKRARQYFDRAGLTSRAKFLVGNAFDLVASELGPFDIIFCDVDKEDYPRVLDVVRPRLRIGGLFLCDNMLWGGRILKKKPEASARGVIDLTRQLMNAPDFLTTVIPVRDGVSVALKTA